MVNKVKKKHLTQYVQKYENVDSFEHITNLGLVYESICETIAAQNSSYSIVNLHNEYIEKTGDNNIDDIKELRLFIRNKFDHIISEEIKYCIGDVLYNRWSSKWVYATVQGIKEANYE